METSELYTAKKARHDYDEKKKFIDGYVDIIKIEKILENIKKNINMMHITSNSICCPDPFIEYKEDLSINERDYLKCLGYKVEYDDCLYKISW